jgi:outer membrane protein assembly factor BamA
MTSPTKILAVLICLFALVAAQAQNIAPNVIEQIEFRGLSRVPVDTVRAIVHCKAGDVYDEKALATDFKALWDTKRFNDIQVKKETGPKGGVVVRFIVTERS